MKAEVFRSKTTNGRIAKTSVYVANECGKDVLVVNQRILAKTEDIRHGGFSNAQPIFYYKDYVLVENLIVFLADSFEKIKYIYNSKKKVYEDEIKYLWQLCQAT
jgi:hypothetical protein